MKNFSSFEDMKQNLKSGDLLFFESRDGSLKFVEIFIEFGEETKSEFSYLSFVLETKNIENFKLEKHFAKYHGKK